MRRLLVTRDGVVDGDTGEIAEKLTGALLLGGGDGGVISGRNLYPQIAAFIDTARSDHGWSAKIHCQEQRTSDPTRVRGMIYVSHLTYRFPKVTKQRNGKRTYSRRTVKWLVLNLELFTESDGIAAATDGLLSLARARGVKPRYSPGSFGSALLRASPYWEKGKQPAPWFISEAARAHLPGNFYARRFNYTKVKRAYYLDQSSSHHTVAAQIDLPDPRYLRARGRFRQVENERSPEFYSRPLETLAGHSGVIIARVTCAHIAPSQLHLYPAWARTPGSHVRWIWTPELRLLDRNVRVEHATAALTSIRPDLALREYATWSLEQLAVPHDTVIKPALLAAYGMLAVKLTDSLKVYSAHGRAQPPRAELVTLPLLDRVFRSTVQRRTVPSMQNVVARGVIEAEVTVRSIELARSLEGEGHPVVHIYADGVIVQCDQLPFLPDGWRVSGALSDVSSPAPHSILSNELVRLPGIPNGRRTAYMRRDADGLHLREHEPPVSGNSVIYSQA